MAPPLPFLFPLSPATPDEECCKTHQTDFNSLDSLCVFLLLVWDLLDIWDGPSGAYIFELQTGVLGQRATKPNWFYAGEGCITTLNENFSNYSNTEFFLIGLLILTPNGVASQPLNFLSKCLIWNRESVYFKQEKYSL